MILFTKIEPLQCSGKILPCLHCTVIWQEMSIRPRSVDSSGHFELAGPQHVNIGAVSCHRIKMINVYLFFHEVQCSSKAHVIKERPAGTNSFFTLFLKLAFLKRI